MIPPQWGMLTTGARPITLPLRIIEMIFASVLNCFRKAAPASDGTTLSGAAGFGTPPRPFWPWQLMQPSRTYQAAPATAAPSFLGTAIGVAPGTLGRPAWI